jgi:hypothetical protein
VQEEEQFHGVPLRQTGGTLEELSHTKDLGAPQWASVRLGQIPSQVQSGSFSGKHHGHLVQPTRVPLKQNVGEPLKERNSHRGGR